MIRYQRIPKRTQRDYGVTFFFFFFFFVVCFVLYIVSMTNATRELSSLTLKELTFEGFQQVLRQDSSFVSEASDKNSKTKHYMRIDSDDSLEVKSTKGLEYESSVVDCTSGNSSLSTDNQIQNGILNINSNTTFIGCAFSSSPSFSSSAVTNITQLVINLPTLFNQTTNRTILLSTLLAVEFINCSFSGTTNPSLNTSSTISLFNSSSSPSAIVSTSAVVVIGSTLQISNSTSPISFSTSSLSSSPSPGLVEVSFLNCTFDHNSSPSSSTNSTSLGPFGGAVFIGSTLGSTSVSFNNCQFSNNVAEFGGAVAVIGDFSSNGTIEVTFASSSFSRNRATFSGAIYSSSASSVSISSTVFSENFSDGKDTVGALQIVNSPLIRLETSLFDSNQAFGGGSVGAVWLENSASFSSFFTPSTPLHEVTNCTFTNNDASFFGLSAAMVANNIPDLLIYNSTFLDNGSDDAICQNGVLTIFNGNLVVEDSTFESNVGGRGGALTVRCDEDPDPTNAYHCDLNVLSTTFQTNTGMLGGAISLSISDGQLIFQDCSFFENGANYGGAIASGGIAPMLVNGTRFRNNFGEAAAGAIYGYSSDDTDLLIVDSQFFNNSVVQGMSMGGGGAIFVNTSQSGVVIISSNFSKNTAYQGQGGAIYILNGTLSITDAMFQNNAVSRDTDVAATGGAIAIFGGTTQISNSTFFSNYAFACGGAIGFFGQNLTVVTTIFKKNSAPLGAGTCFDFDGSPNQMSAYFSECNWDSNSGTLGAGIYVGGGEVTVENSTLQNQLADLHGGAFFLSGRFTKIAFNGCSFTSNIALALGGAGYLTEGTVEMDGCLIEHHDDISDRSGIGTVMHQSSGVLTVTDSMFRNNSNFSYRPQGILLYLGDGVTHFSNSHFIFNEAVLSTTEPGPRLTFDNCTFIRNTAVIPILSMPAGDISFIHCLFEFNLVLSPTAEATTAILIEDKKEDEMVRRRGRSGVSYCIEFHFPSNAYFESTTIIGNFTNQLSSINTPVQLVSTSITNSAAQFRAVPRGKRNETVSSLEIIQSTFVNSEVIVWGNAVQQIIETTFEQSQIVFGSEEGQTHLPQVAVVIQDSILSECDVLLSDRDMELIQSTINGTFLIDSSSTTFLGCNFVDVTPESIVLSGDTNLTIYASPFCIVDPPGPIVSCSSKASFVGGNFNNSLVSDKCTKNTFPLPLNQLARINDGFTTLCGLQTYQIFIDYNQVGFTVNLTISPDYIPPQPTPTLSGLIALGCDSNAYEPQAVFEANAGAEATLALSWTTTQNPAYPPLQPNTTYCLTISSSLSASHSLPLGVSIHLLPHGVSLPESTLVATNPYLVGTQQMTFEYEINDEWGHYLVPNKDSPIKVTDDSGQVVFNIIESQGLFTLVPTTSEWKPIARVHLYLGGNIEGNPEAIVVIISVWWLVMVVGVGAIFGMVWYFIKRMRRYKREVEKNLGLISEKDQEITELANVWKIDEQELTWRRLLDKGGYGEVWLCEWRETHIVAVKKLRPEWLELAGEVAWGDFEAEVKFLRTIRHPNITLFYGAGQLIDGTPFLVVEYLTRGSVYNVLKKHPGTIPWRRRVSFLYDAAKGMEFLHSRTPPLLHRDLKPQNLLVAKNWKVKISDFGTAKLLSDLAPNHSSSHSNFSGVDVDESEMRSLLTDSNPSFDPFVMSIDVGSILYMAPEITRKAGAITYGKAVDVFSFGMTMWTVAKGNGEEPHGGMKTMVEVEDFVLAGGRPSVPGDKTIEGGGRRRRKPGKREGEGEEGEEVTVREEKEERWPLDWVELMKRCWENNPGKRPSFSQIVEALRDMLGDEPLPPLLDDPLLDDD